MGARGMVKLPWQKANSRVEQVAVDFAKLVQAYVGLSEPAKNTVARRIPSYFVGNVDSRKKRLQKENNQAFLASRYGAAVIRNGRTSNRTSTRASNRASNRTNRSGRSNNTNNSRRNNWWSNSRNTRAILPANLSQTRYSSRSTNNRIVY